MKGPADIEQQVLLTEKQFAYITEQCDAVLKEHASVFSITGIAWLHVLHSHPSIQERYIPVFHKRSIGEFLKIIFRGSGILAADFFITFFSAFKNKQAWQNIPPETDVLFISHFLNAKTPKSSPDFYFQDLPQYLQKHNYHTAIGLMNHVDGFAGWKENNFENEVTKFLLPRRLGLKKELSIIGRCIKAAIFFFKQYLVEKELLKKSFLLELSGNTLSPHTIRAYRMYEVVSYLIQHSEIKVAAFTWEGHSWERMVCHAAKKANKKVLAIGYQHTILYPSSHAVKKSMGFPYDPDIILTVGSVTRDILISAHEFGKVKIKEYGSPRLVRGHSFEINSRVEKSCLVAPDGLVNECITLFTFAIKVAKLMPETDFIFRTHPIIIFSDLQEMDKRLQNLPANVIISSNKNIEDDFKKCSWLLYRISSVSFFAILAGLRPVYLSIENEISNDVLFKLNSWRKQVNQPEELRAIINKDKQASDDERDIEREEAYRFSKAYMVPYDVSIFEQCISDELIHE